MYIYCIHLFMSLFIIPSQSVFGKSFAKPMAKAFRKTSNVCTAKNQQTHLFTGQNPLAKFIFNMLLTQLYNVTQLQLLQ